MPRHDPRILQLITSTSRRGAETFAVELEAALTERGFAIHTAALVKGTGGSQLEVDMLGTRRLGLGTLRAIRQRARAADVVIAHGSTTLPAALLATAGSRRSVLYRSIGDITQWNQSLVRRVRTRELLRRCDAVVALTASAAADLEMLGVQPSRISVIANGVPERRFPLIDAQQRQRARDLLSIPAGSVVLFLGALEPEKNVETAVRAVAALDDVHLLVAGDGSRRAELEALARDVLSNRAHFVGAVDHSASVLTAADVLVLPSLTEGLPGSVIEAAFTGVPTVASDVGYLREAIIPGETGFLVAPTDVAGFTSNLREALVRRDQLGAAARTWCVERFGMARIADSWARLLRSVVARNTTTGSTPSPLG